MKNSEVLLNFWGEIDKNVEITPLNFNIEIRRDELSGRTFLEGGYQLGWRSSISDNDFENLRGGREEVIAWLRRKAERQLRDRLATDGIKALLDSDRAEQHNMVNTLTGDVSVVLTPLIAENMIIMHPRNFGQMIQWFQFKDV